MLATSHFQVQVMAEGKKMFLGSVQRSSVQVTEKQNCRVAELSTYPLYQLRRDCLRKKPCCFKWNIMIPFPLAANQMTGKGINAALFRISVFISTFSNPIARHTYRVLSPYHAAPIFKTYLKHI